VRHRVAIPFALAVCLIGCGSPVVLLTGGYAGCFAGMAPRVTGLLISDAEHGTAIKVERVEDTWGRNLPAVGTVAPVMWPTGYTGRRAGSELEVLNEAGDVVATTGKRYDLEPQVEPPRTNASIGVFVTCRASAAE
jgi:hypothetical protein